MNTRQIAESIFMAGVKRVMPDEVIRRRLVEKDGLFWMGDVPINSPAFDKVYVLGAGKASAKMATAIEGVLGDKICSGHLVVKYGHSSPLHRTGITEAGHPVPDVKGLEGTRAILDIAAAATERDLVICLFSGGGSALLADLPPGCSLDELARLNEDLLRSGATIHEINTVRKHLSGIKGGFLAKAAFPATMVTLVLSDVIGDPLDVIASGPTVADPSTFADALAVLEKYGLNSRLPPAIIAYLKDGINGAHPETPKPGDMVFSKAQTHVIGNNRMALGACLARARLEGLNSFIITPELHGNVFESALSIIETAMSYQHNDAIKKPCCLLFGGETTLKVTGPGMGGRNQHMALIAAQLLKGKTGITFLAAGTDGSDGPTKAAGAVVDFRTHEDAVRAGIDPMTYLTRFDSFHFFEKAGGHVITGPTLTNVMDLIVVLVE